MGIPQFLWVGLQGFHLDDSVLLWSHSLPGRSIVVHARLTVLRGEYCIPLPELDLAALLQSVEVPADKLVIVWVGIRGDE